MSDEQLLKKYEEMDYILHLSDGLFWQDILRTIGGGIVFLLSWLNNFIEGIIDKIVTFNNFYSSGPMKEFMDVARPVVWGVFFIALFVLGFQFMLNKVEKRNEVVLNIILALCFIVVIPDLMTNLGKITNQSIKTLNPETESLAGELVKSNVADVLYYAEKGFKYSSRKDGDSGLPPRPQSNGNMKVGTTNFTYANQLPKQHTWVYIPYTQKLDVHDKEPKEIKNLSDDAIEVLSHRAIPTGKGTSQTVQELKKNVVIGTGIGRESYYRYHVNWLVLILSLLVTTIALVITVIKIGRAIFDLGFHQIYGMFVAVTDLTGGQRTKKVLTEIISTFAVIFIMAMLLKVFMMYSVWVNGLKSSIGAIGVLLLLIAGAWAIIDAPDIVQRTLGIDAGLRSGWQAMMGAYAGARTAGAMGGMLSKGSGSLTNLVTGGANFSKRAVEGIFTKTPEELKINKTKAKQIPTPTNLVAKVQNQNQVPNAGIQKDINSVTETVNTSSPIQTVADQKIDKIDSQTLNTNGKIQSTNVQHLEKEARTKKINPIPSQNPSQKSGIVNDTVLPSGYEKTKSGILIPHSQTISSPISSENSTISSTPSEQVGESVNDTVPSKVTSVQSESGPATIASTPYGHKEVTHQNTWIGGNRRIQRFKENWTRAGNSGFDLGQNVRRGVLASKKLLVNTNPLRAVSRAKSIQQSISDIKLKQSESIGETRPKLNRKEVDE